MYLSIDPFAYLICVRLKKKKAGVNFINLTVNFVIGNRPILIGAPNKSYGTWYSHVVPNRSTDQATSGLTAEIGRVPVLFTVYGHSCRCVSKSIFYTVYTAIEVLF